jgi:hypothetical protein
MKSSCLEAPSQRSLFGSNQQTTTEASSTREYVWSIGSAEGYGVALSTSNLEFLIALGFLPKS